MLIHKFSLTKIVSSQAVFSLTILTSLWMIRKSLFICISSTISQSKRAHNCLHYFPGDEIRKLSNALEIGKTGTIVCDKNKLHLCSVVNSGRSGCYSDITLWSSP